ncbi:C4-dicarboxylate ABC transporter substrate-binding protein [Halarcobacter ebronensis]|uniref:C4-dicarboxylate ABC transporter substrate-binding protein n=1 Tax=Halarcobacter ebronensis TaxID=1462615 RepID=A0A4Q0YC22_9BACT|nr:TAXI family TRAP transporter solute-binding subunit [Halarcobacter ebronensis]RXJ66639.1 C4-dicarboxylate ABC transporter substrate-binding protein [Halarcobacter ebronensis]
MKKILIFIFTFNLSIFGTEFITIGTGSVTGTYYPTGGAICKLVNKYKKETKIRCSVEATDASVYNIMAINEGELDFGIVQSDAVYQAINGIGKFKNAPVEKLRSVFSIYTELFTLVTRKDANIHSIDDIKGKRINIGNTGSGNEATSMTLLNELNIKTSDFSYVGRLKAGEAPNALRDNLIDGYFYMVGHPTANIKDAANSTDIDITPLNGKKIDAFINKNPYYIRGVIPSGLYKGLNKDVPTFGVKAVLVTSSDVSTKAVYTLVKAILEDFEHFKALHPVYKYITKESLLEGLNAPLHDGALKYFKENNFIK